MVVAVCSLCPYHRPVPGPACAPIGLASSISLLPGPAYRPCMMHDGGLHSQLLRLAQSSTLSSSQLENMLDTACTPPSACLPACLVEHTGIGQHCMPPSPMQLAEARVVRLLCRPALPCSGGTSSSGRASRATAHGCRPHAARSWARKATGCRRPSSSALYRIVPHCTACMRPCLHNA